MDGPPRKKHRERSASVVGISRSIAACQRCRSKKIKCDQNFPKCSKCERAGLECVGIDPATGREVPRSYVYHLEEKVQRLETLLRQNGLDPSGDEGSPASASVSVSAASEPVNPMGVTFAKLMLTANRMNLGPSDSSASVPVDVAPAILPPKKTAMEFIRIFFAQSNSQLPVLHRETFLRDIFIPIYGAWDENVSLASDYSGFNTACYEYAIVPDDQTWLAQYKNAMSAQLTGDQDPARVSVSISTPEEFRRPLFFLNIIFAISSSTNHLQYHTHMSESFKEAAMRHVDSTYSTADPLEQLEAVLLQTLYSVMRPNVPGVWYLLGTALRLCVDMGLHKEEHPKAQTVSAFTKDRRRRLFWSTYSIDRQMCFYLGRPVGIPEESITARLPSELDDAFIDCNDNEAKDYSDNSGGMASYKTITLSFFKVRQIQSECQRILYENGELPRRFSNLAQWKTYISNELELWRTRCPKKPRKMNCEFNTEFFDLNYYHTLLLINGLSKKTFQLGPEAYLKVLDASKGLMSIYSKLYHKKAINYTWAAVHNLFMAGTSYLFVLYNSEHSRSSTSADEVKAITEDCLSVLASLVASCTAAKSCMDTFSMLTAVVLKLRYDIAVEGTMVGISKHQLDSVSGTGSLKGNLASLVEGIANESEYSQQEVALDSPRFGWVSREALETEPRSYEQAEQALPTPMMPETHLEDFFLELENLSPVSSIKEPTNMDLTLSGEMSSGQNRDGKRVFELIQQMPTEPIWDQFFGRSIAPSFKQEPTTP